jgi:signal peptidase I
LADDQGMTRGFWATWAAVTFRPGASFSAPVSRLSSWSGVRFALVLSALSLAVQAFFEALLTTHSLSRAISLALVMLLVGPVITFVGLYLGARLAHWALGLVGGRHQPFAETFASFCYGHAPSLFAIIPLVGSPVAGVWCVVATCIGLKRAHATSTGRALFSVLAGPVAMIALALVLRAFVIEAFKIPSGAMIPTIQVGDHIFVNKLIPRLREPQRGEVVVFIFPKDRDKDFIKRVVAIGGDTVQVRDNVLYVNDKPVPRTHVEGDCQYDDYVEDEGRWERRRCDAWTETLDGRSYTTIFDPSAQVRSTEPVKVPPKSFFVMGDNRDNSYDSRFWGTVPNELLKGTAMFVWWSAGGESGAPRISRVGQSIH